MEKMQMRKSKFVFTEQWAAQTITTVVLYVLGSAVRHISCTDRLRYNQNIFKIYVNKMDKMVKNGLKVANDLWLACFLVANYSWREGACELFDTIRNN